MRWTILVVLAACSYKSPPDLQPSDGAPVDQPITVDTPEIDAPPLGGPRMRTIDVVDAKVTGGPHAGFPVLISLLDNDLRGVAQGGRVTSDKGFDIQFFADAGRTMQLAHEIEAYDAATGQLVAWVKIPSLTAATTFFLYYGDPAITTEQQDRPAVWTSYAAVYHLTDLADALATSPGTNVGSTAVTGNILGGRAFDGNGQRVDVAATTAIANVFAGGGTVEAWVLADTAGGGNLGRIFEKGDVVRMGRCDNAVTNAMFFSHAFTGGAGTWCSPTNSAPLGTWIHMTVVYNRNSPGNVPVMYLNGAAVAVALADITPSGTAVPDSSLTLTLGDRGSGGRAFDGIVDELRFSKSTRDAGWVATSYENQRDPAAFVVVQ